MQDKLIDLEESLVKAFAGRLPDHLPEHMDMGYNPQGQRRQRLANGPSCWKKTLMGKRD